MRHRAEGYAGINSAKCPVLSPNASTSTPIASSIVIYKLHSGVSFSLFAAGLATLPPFGFARHDCPTNAVGDQPGTKREQRSACPEGTHDLWVFSDGAGETAAHSSKLLLIAT